MKRQTREKIENHFEKPIYGKLTSLFSVSFFCWLMYCGFTVGYSESIKSTNKEVADYKIFKDECLNLKGNIRHEESFWLSSVYCVQKSGDESVFYSFYESAGFINLFTDKLFFGIPEFEKLHYESSSKSIVEKKHG
jgi:hypothetical protein